MKTLSRHLCLTHILLLAFVHTAHANEALQFAESILPIFQQHCVRCHAPGISKGEISLATFSDLKQNEYVIEGDPDGSYLIELVTSQDGQPPEMPKGGDPLSATEVEQLRRWISEGASWPESVVVKEKPKADGDWWSFQPLNDFSADGQRTKTIDDFVQAKLAEKGLSFNPAADRRTLIRRASYDLIGLPPSPEEVAAFVSDPDPRAYERLVDRLLASPQYGERWGRHWLDVVRFGESIGYERNVIINNLWPFRDYVIRSLNDDKPFDQLIREHIAGDVLGPNDADMAVGSAFLVAGPYDDVGNQDAAQAAQIRANTLDEIIRATSEAFLGVTIGCARCHDHKFDPITQQDYYGLYATFAGVRHGAQELASAEAKAARASKLDPLLTRKQEIEQAQTDLRASIVERAKGRLAEYEARWTRPPVDRTATEERFEAVTAKFVRLVCEAQDVTPNRASGFGIDEFQIWSVVDGPSAESVNVALASNGGKATGTARSVEDFPGAYSPELAIDGKRGARFIAAGTDLTIELVQPTPIDRVVFSNAKSKQDDEWKFAFVADYRIEVSDDGMNWRAVASGADRQPVNRDLHLNHRLLHAEVNDEDQAEKASLKRELNRVKQAIAQVPSLPSVWIGQRVASDAKGPFHVFVGGSPQKPGEEVVPASLGVLNHNADSNTTPDELAVANANGHYRLAADAAEAERRRALADWLVHANNPLTPRVLANRLWHYHFGTGIVDTPSDFGYMGGRPTHPKLLDFLAVQLQENNWRIKNLHRLIMTSRAYRQSGDFRPKAAQVDSASRLLWRFPPRRVSAEEIRDTILLVSGKLDLASGGPGFRLYHFMQDNVCTYVPLDHHGPETYRRAVYHQNARASVVDLMTDFDQPDCTFSAPKRAETTTPLQALTMLNHAFTLDMASALAERLEREAGNDPVDQLCRAFQLCYSRDPEPAELDACQQLIDTHGLAALCRTLLNTSELIYVR